MRPARFRIERPPTLAQALEVLAGGQALLKQLRERTIAPGALLDISRISEPAFVRCSESGVEIGTLTTLADLLASALPNGPCAALVQAAAIAAVDPYIAEDALAAIDVEYELLAPVTTMAGALEPGAPRLYEDWPDNRCLEWRFSAGEPDRALARAVHRVALRIPHHRYTGTPLEGRVALAEYDTLENRLRVTLSTQSTHVSRTLLAQTLGLPEGRIQIITRDVGGGFGIKLQVDAEVIPCLLAMRTGRPVLWSETRAENLLSGIHARDYVWEIEGGFDADGRLTALAAQLTGDFVLLTGMQDIGQGVETTLAQVVADEFKVTPAAVNVLAGETHGVPYGLGAWSSRGASFGVSAAVESARRLADKRLRIGAHMLEVAPHDVELVDGAVVVKGAPFRRKTYREIGNGVYLWPGPLVTVPEGLEPNLEATYTWTNPIARWVPDAAGTLSIYTTHPSGCFAVICAVDIETGKIAIERLYAAHDCGTVINPRIDEGQLIGGCVQGLGAVLGEELGYDADGHLQNQGFWDYLIPQAADVSAIEIGHLVSPSPNTPLGTKGMDEGGPVGVPPAVVAAVENALAPFGVRVSELPLTPERVLALIDASPARRAWS